MNTIVIGSGFAGTAAALHLAEHGIDTTLVSFGLGGFNLSSGLIDILGYGPDRIDDPIAALATLPATHPYASMEPADIEAALTWFTALVPGLVGDPHHNVVLPTAVGALRPTAYAPLSCRAAVEGQSRPWGVVGIKQLKDFQAALVSGNLNRQGWTTRPLCLDFPARAGEQDASALTFARALDDPDTLARFVDALAAQLDDAEGVLIPAILGLDPTTWERCAAALGRPVAEIPLPPPSVLGLRMQAELTRRLDASGVRVYRGSRVLGMTTVGAHATHVTLGTAGHTTTLPADAIIHCAGGFESGALLLDSHTTLHETVLGLPVQGWEGEPTVADQRAPQPLFACGLRSNRAGLVLDDANVPVADNVYAAGGCLAGAQRWHELSGEGIAIATAVRAATSIEEAAHV